MESNGAVSVGDVVVVEESQAAVGVAEAVVAAADGVDSNGPGEEPVRIYKGIYFVRVPRPLFDDTAIKNLQTDLTNQITKLKGINSKMQAKRTEATGIRQQLQDARGIRDTSKPEYEEKMTKIKEYQDLRKDYMDRISLIRSGQKGLDVKTEEDLDAKIAELEKEIESGEVPLRVEKQLVQNISKLRSQRDKVREFQNQQGDLSQLEADMKKVKAILAELQDEFKIITGERGEVKEIIGNLQAKLKVVTDGLADLDSERQEIEAHKVEIQEALKAAREENDAAMFEYRENRKLSLQLRELVEAGAVEEATRLAEEQVDLYLAKLRSDAAYRKEYTKLWSQQRKYIVSELLPKSGVASSTPAPRAAMGEKGRLKDAAPLVPQGAAKAQAAIAAAMEAADQALAAQRKTQAAAEPEEPSSEEEEAEVEPASSSAPAVPSRRIVPGATEELTAPSRPSRAAAKPMEYVVPEVPEVDYEFVPPVIQREEQEQLSEKERKERIREEQRLKAAEAEERKKKKAEAAAKKKQKAADLARKQEEEAKAARQQRQQVEPAPADDMPELVASDEEPAAAKPVAAAVAAPSVGAQKQKGSKPAKKPVREKVVKLPKKAKKWYMEYAVPLGVGGFVLVLVLLVYMALSVPPATK